MIGENYMKQIIFSLKHWVNNNFALKENIPEHTWENLSDKPFYKKVTENLIEWDGNTEGLVASTTTSDTFEQVFYKISDQIFSTENFENGCTISYLVNDELNTVNINYEDIFFSDNFISISNSDGDFFVLSIAEDNFTQDPIYFSEKGIYVTDNVRIIDFGSVTEIKLIDEEYIPDSIARISELPDEVCVIPCMGGPETSLVLPNNIITTIEQALSEHKIIVLVSGSKQYIYNSRDYDEYGEYYNFIATTNVSNKKITFTQIKVREPGSVVYPTLWSTAPVPEATSETTDYYLKNYGSYWKASPLTNIKKSNLAEEVRITLDKADNSLQNTDISDWAKADTKPIYTYDEVGADPSGSALESLVEAKSYADTAVAALVNSAPETLDTLGELATAFQENADMVATLDAAVTNKAEKSDLDNLAELVDLNATNIESLQAQVLPTSLILADAITGVSYTIQIQNGQLVSFETTT